MTQNVNGQSHLILGDCLEKMKDIPDNSIDLILTDLPYGITQNKWDSELPLEILWSQFKRIRKDNTAVILFGNGLFSAKLMLSNEKEWKYNLIWEKDRPTGFLNAKKMPLRSHEDIMIFYAKPVKYNPQKWVGKSKNHGLKSPTPHNNNSYGKSFHVDNSEEFGNLKYPRSVLYFPKPHPSKHPSEKPVALLEYLIKTYSNENDMVLDCCAGIGTTAVACLNTNRSYLCIELDKKYYNNMTERIKQNQPKLEAWQT